MNGSSVNGDKPMGASTFAKGLRVLECFESGRRDLTMAEMARLTGFDRATVRRLCLTLQQSGYLIQTDRTFRLTARIVAATGGYFASNAFGLSVQPVLNACAERLDGEVTLAVLDGSRAVLVAQSAVSSARLSLGLSVGSCLPLSQTAVGRMLLAGLGPTVREEVLQTLDACTNMTAENLGTNDIRNEIDKAATDAYAFASGAFEAGAAGVAVPLGLVGGQLAVLGTTDTVNRFEREGELARILENLRRAAIMLRRQGAVA